MAIFFPRINTIGATTGFIMSIIILLTIMTYSSVHLLLYGFIGVTVSIIIAYIVSLFTPGVKKDLAGLTYKTLDK